MATEEKQWDSDHSDVRRETLTNKDKLALAKIPLRAQVLNVPTQESDNDIDRRSSINVTFCLELTDRKMNALFLTDEEYAEVEITTVRMVRNVRTKLMQNYLQISMHQTNDVMVVDTLAYVRVRSRVSIDYILDIIKRVRHGLHQQMVKLMRTKT